ALGVEASAVHAVLGSRLGRSFGNEQQEAFWLTVLGFFARHPMIDTQQIGPICDFLYEQKFTPTGAVLVNGIYEPGPPQQPGLSMAGRDPATLVAQVQQWHRGLARARSRGVYGTLVWAPCGVPGMVRTEGADRHQPRIFRVEELLSGVELRAEGAAMHHCVATYAWSCQQRRSAIFSVRIDHQRLLTVEVDLRSMTVVQVRGRLNETATPIGERVVRIWSTQAALQIGTYAFGRRW
ncbi:MAG: hypothetical protein JWM57_1003, partial [Phycisphaerales bacterium]|nr:hypothetical protein [Phycisphaerales bacterium]